MSDDRVLAFIQSGVKPLLAAQESLTEARDRVARLEAELVAARLEVEIAERKHRGHSTMMADAFDLLHEQRGEPTTAHDVSPARLTAPHLHTPNPGGTP